MTIEEAVRNLEHWLETDVRYLFYDNPGPESEKQRWKRTEEADEAAVGRLLAFVEDVVTLRGQKP